MLNSRISEHNNELVESVRDDRDILSILNTDEDDLNVLGK